MSRFFGCCSKCGGTWRTRHVANLPPKVAWRRLDNASSATNHVARCHLQRMNGHSSGSSRSRSSRLGNGQGKALRKLRSKWAEHKYEGNSESKAMKLARQTTRKNARQQPSGKDTAKGEESGSSRQRKMRNGLRRMGKCCVDYEMSVKYLQMIGTKMSYANETD
ncbi:uncharacterized protein LOC132793901 [Drosophila nasuta]|uniref:uncharacterized protein LOC132793901 n=1 Tax=Drosophila nasuta TaxID=42062 RepID=UPI00295E6A69|nr:uncharacterized protein LOC132793901 [Drosophila nasuta]